MTPKTAATYRIDDELKRLLREIKERDGVPVSEQIHRAIVLWVESNGLKVPSALRRGHTRRKA